MYKFDKEKMQQTMDLYLQNEGWKETYENAPSDSCKKFLRLSFYKSQNGEPSGDEYIEVRDEIYSELGVEDWAYLEKSFGNSPFRATCRKKLAELGHNM